MKPRASLARITTSCACGRTPEFEITMPFVTALLISLALVIASSAWIFTAKPN